VRRLNSGPRRGGITCDGQGGDASDIYGRG
jgi:hypothetical protein